MRILCLVENYISDGNLSEGFFVHNRNKFCQEQGADVEVVSFSCQKEYNFDGIKVLDIGTYLKKNINEKDTILVCHAANIRHHYIFLRKYMERYRKIVFYFHGHEILMINSVYSPPFNFAKQDAVRRVFQDYYDRFKIKLWRKFILKNMDKIFLFFVSDWMRDKFTDFTKIQPYEMNGHYSVTYNAIGKYFEENEYDRNENKKYDFITIRGNLDNSKYGVDIVNNLAKLNPEKQFLLIGKGKFFEYNKKSINLDWINTVFDHQTIMKYLNMSKIALMPTRTDAQGVMACEIASTGMPLITSDISVCHEIFDEFKNVKFIDNDHLSKLEKDFLEFPLVSRNKKYFSDNTNYNEYLILISL